MLVTVGVYLSQPLILTTQLTVLKSIPIYLLWKLFVNYWVAVQVYHVYFIYLFIATFAFNVSSFY